MRRPHQEIGALNNSKNNRRPTVIVGRRVADDLAYRRPIVVFEPAPKGVGHKFFGYSAGKLLGLTKQQPPQSGKPVDFWAARGSAARVNGLAQFVNGTPAADNVKILGANPRGTNHQWEA